MALTQADHLRYHFRCLFLHHLVQSPGFVPVAVDAVLDLLGGIAHEMICLALHGAHAAHLEHQPAHGLRLALQILWQHTLIIKRCSS